MEATLTLILPWSILKGANSFFLEKTPFQKGLGVQDSKQEYTKVVSLVKTVENVPLFVSSLLNNFCIKTCLVSTNQYLLSQAIPMNCSGTKIILDYQKNVNLSVCLFLLRFYGQVNPMVSCRARSVYLTTLLLGRLIPLGS